MSADMIGDVTTADTAGARALRPMSILFTNIVLDRRTGTEVATLELAQALRARGHEVAIYAPTLGQSALQARMLGIAVSERIDTMGFTPDIIHGHHNVALAAAMVRFTATPAVFVCHDSANPYDRPLLDERIGAYVAVDAATRARLRVDGVPEALISVMANGIDLSRFRLRAQWPQRPRTALLVVKQRHEHVALVEAACTLAGVALEVVGPGVGRVVSNLPERVAQADIVFAHSRSAIEAAASGAQVIVIDEFGFGGALDLDAVTSFPDGRLWRRILAPLPTAEALAATIAGFAPAAAEAVAHAVRAQADLELVAARWERLYADVLARAPAPDTAAQRASLAGFVAQFLPRVTHVTEAEELEARRRQHAAAVDHTLALLQDVSGEGLHTVPFGTASAGQAMLERGWYDTEDWGVWSASEVATILLPSVVLARWQWGVRVKCSRYMPQSAPRDVEDGDRPVEVLIGDRQVAVWRFAHGDFRGPADKSILVPEDLRPLPGQSLMLTFRIHRPISPLEAGEHPDPRRLGLRLTEFLPPEPPVTEAAAEEARAEG